MSSTTQQIGSALKTFAKVGGVVLLQILLFTGVGIILNIILAIFLWPEYTALVPDGSNPGARAGGALAILIAIWYVLPPILLALGFLVGMPIIFLFVGKKQGIKAAISKIIHEKGDNMVYFIVSKFTDRMANDPKWAESVKQNGIVKTVRNKFPGFIKTLNGLPWLLKRPLKIVFETIDFATAIEDAVKTRPDAPINSPETNAHITESVASKLKAKFPPPKGKLLLFMILINILIFVLVKIFV